MKNLIEVLPIKNNENLLCFANYCIELVGVGFHWNNLFEEYVDSDGNQCFNEHKCFLLNERLEEALKLDHDLFTNVIVLLCERKFPNPNFKRHLKEDL